MKIPRIAVLISAPLFMAVSKKKPTRSSAATRPARKPKAVASKSTAGNKRGSPKPRREAPAPPPPPQPLARNQPAPKVVEPQPEAPKPQAPIGAPGLFSPRAGQAVESLTPSFRWFYVGGATRYEVEWSVDAHFHKGRTATLIANQTAVSLDSDQALRPGATYVWRVRGGNDGGWGPWSQTETFRAPDM